MSKPTKTKVQLKDSDWAALFPSKPYTIGTTSVEIEPLSIQELAAILDKITLISDKIQENTSTSDDVSGISSSVTVLNLVKTVMEYSPDILSDISNIALEDIQSLPLDEALSLFNFCLDVNIESQDSLIKNFQGLTERMQKFMRNQTTKTVQNQLEN